MAPEALEEGARVGISADAYAYGVLAWELLTREKPWAGQNHPQIITSVLVRNQRLPRPHKPIVPELADWAVDCFGVAAERPTMRALEQKLDDLLCSDESDLEMLRAGLAEALRGDKDAYEEAWDLYAGDPSCGEMLDLCALLAKRHGETPRQPESCRSVDDLLGLAAHARDDFHDTISGLVKNAGGEYRRGPTKTRERCVEKMSREYDGDVRRVVDVERATALFANVSTLHEGLRQLSRLKGGSDLEVVRVKDGFGSPKPSGWRCVYFSLRHAPSGLVSELQVTFDKIKAINGRSHRIYNLVRCMERGVEPATRTVQAAEETRRAAVKSAEAQAARGAAEARAAAAERKAAEAEKRLRAAEAKSAEERRQREAAIAEEKRRAAAAQAAREKKQREDAAAAEAERKRRAAEAKASEEKRQREVAEAERNRRAAEAKAAEAERKLRAAEAKAKEEQRRRAAAAGKSPAAWYSEGIARKNEKKWPEAIKAFQNCVALDANHSNAWCYLGWALEQRDGKLSEALIEPYTRCIALDPKHAMAHNNLGLVLNNVRKDYDGAEKMFRKAIALDPNDAYAHSNLGIVLKEVRKDYDGAEKMYRKAIELDPKYANARWNLSQILEDQKNDIPGAVKLMEEYVNLGGIPGWNDGKDRLARLRAK